VVIIILGYFNLGSAINFGVSAFFISLFPRTFQDFSWLFMTLAVFHDFPGLENGFSKFHDFPGVVTLCECPQQQQQQQLYLRGLPISRRILHHCNRVNIRVFSSGNDSFRHSEKSFSPQNNALQSNASLPFMEYCTYIQQYTWTHD